MNQAIEKRAKTALDYVGSDVWRNEVLKVIPKEIVIEAMLRIARSVATDPKFANADPQSFLQALLKCGRAGLYPDGREAHLIAFGRDVQCIFDVKGICALATRAGILVSPKLVLEHDSFEVEEDDGTGKTKVVHRIDYRKPRGEIVVAYSRAVLPDGRVDYEIMSADEVEHVRERYSKAKDSSPWKNSWGEMAKKTVVKRHSKRWDMSPEIRQALNADDDSMETKELKVSAPLFRETVREEPVQEAEIIHKSVQEPGIEVSVPDLLLPVATPPVVAVPKPRPVKAPIQPPTPQKAAEEPKKEPQMLSILETLKQRMKTAGVSVDQLLRFLVEIGNISETTATLEEVAIESPNVLDMVYTQFDDIANRIKGIEI